MTTKELKVAALCNGTVIDHIPCDKLFAVVSILKLKNSKNQITIGNNFDSRKMTTKGIIKVSDHFFAEDETNKITIIAPSAVINIIRDYQVIEKRTLVLPDEIGDIVQCANPKCITNHQPVATRFKTIDEEGKIALKCDYCEKEIKLEEVRIK